MHDFSVRQTVGLCILVAGLQSRRHCPTRLPYQKPHESDLQSSLSHSAMEFLTSHSLANGGLEKANGPGAVFTILILDVERER